MANPGLLCTRRTWISHGRQYDTVVGPMPRRKVDIGGQVSGGRDYVDPIYLRAVLLHVNAVASACRTRNRSNMLLHSINLAAATTGQSSL